MTPEERNYALTNLLWDISERTLHQKIK